MPPFLEVTWHATNPSTLVRGREYFLCHRCDLPALASLDMNRASCLIFPCWFLKYSNPDHRPKDINKLLFLHATDLSVGVGRLVQLPYRLLHAVTYIPINADVGLAVLPNHWVHRQGKAHFSMRCVEKMYPLWFLQSLWNRSILFFEIVARSTKSAALKNERLRQALDRQTTEGWRLEQSLTNRRFY